MIQVIARQGSRPYSGFMASAILRLVMLVALALMPFGMGGAAAVAAMPAAAAAAAPDSCGDHHQPAQESPMKVQLHCGACAALAAIEAPQPIVELRPELPRILKTADSLSDTEPDPVTPPPRIS